MVFLHVFCDDIKKKKLMKLICFTFFKMYSFTVYQSYFFLIGVWVFGLEELFCNPNSIEIVMDVIMPVIIFGLSVLIYKIKSYI